MGNLTPAQLDWMRHSISLTEAACNIPLHIRPRVYPDTPLAHHQHILNMKRAALRALEAGAPMNDDQRRHADFLLATADAHERHYGSDRAAFDAAMREARGILRPADAPGRAA